MSRTRILAIVALAMMVISLTALSVSWASRKRNADYQAVGLFSLQQTQISITGEPTPIQVGVMTEIQKEHSKLFKGYAEEVTGGKSLVQLVAEKGNVQVIRHAGTLIVPRSFNAGTYLQSFTCKADAVIIGVVKKKASQLTEEGAFLFTDYELKVEEVLKNDPRNMIHLTNSLIVTRAGGVVTLNGHTVQAVDFAQKLLEPGGRYLIFLRLVPATGAYKSLSDNYHDNAFRLIDNSIAQVSDLPFPFGPSVTSNAAGFLDSVRAAAGGKCAN